MRMIFCSDAVGLELCLSATGLQAFFRISCVASDTVAVMNQALHRQRMLDMKKRIIFLTSLLISLGATTALAGTSGIDQRQNNQEGRIEQGVRSGELTATESARLFKGQAELQRMEYRSKRDGVVTDRERVRLQRKASTESARIYRHKHNGNRRSSGVAY